MPSGGFKVNSTKKKIVLIGNRHFYGLRTLTTILLPYLYNVIVLIHYYVCRKKYR